MEEIFSAAIFPVSTLDTHCHFSKWLITFYDFFSPKLVKDIHKNYDVHKHTEGNKNIKDLTERIYMLKNMNIPQYIYEIEEFLFWAKCIQNDMYFIFDNRLHFYNFYVTAISIRNPEIRRNFGFPSWIEIFDNMYKYIYLSLINHNGNNRWKMNYHNFFMAFDIINDKNKKILSKNKN
jgi:hypothetical protein